MQRVSGDTNAKGWSDAFVSTDVLCQVSHQLTQLLSPIAIPVPPCGYLAQAMVELAALALTSSHKHTQGEA